MGKSKVEWKEGGREECREGEGDREREREMKLMNMIGMNMNGEQRRTRLGKNFEQMDERTRILGYFAQ